MHNLWFSRFEEAYNVTKLDELGISKSEYKNGYWFGNQTIESNQQLSDGFAIFDKVSFSLQEIMKEIKISTSSIDNATIYIDFTEELDSRVAHWNEVSIMVILDGSLHVT